MLVGILQLARSGLEQKERSGKKTNDPRVPWAVMTAAGRLLILRCPVNGCYGRLHCLRGYCRLFHLFTGACDRTHKYRRHFILLNCAFP